MKGCLLIVLAMLSTPAHAVSAKCKWIRQNYQQYTNEQLEQIADTYGLSQRDRERAKRCLGRK